MTHPVKAPTRGLGRSVGFTFGASLLNVVAGVLAGIIVARSLAPEGRGDLLALTVWAGLVASVATVGLEESVIHRSAGDPATALRMIRSLRRVLAGQSILGAVAILVIGHTLAEKTLGTGSPVALVALGSLAPLNVIIQIFMAPMRVAGRLGAWNLVRICPGLAYVASLSVVASESSLSVESAVWCLLIANLLTVVAAVGFRVHAGSDRTVADKEMIRDARRYGATLVGAGLPNMANQRMDQLVLAALASSYQLGIYSVAASFVSVLSLLGTSVEQILFPRVSAGAMTRRDVVRATLGVASLAALMATTIGLLAEPLISILYGADFKSAATPLVLLAPGAVALVAVAGLTAEAKGEGRVRDLALAQVSGAVVTVSLVIPAVLGWGIVGAAVVSSLSYSTILAALLWRRR